MSCMGENLCIAGFLYFGVFLILNSACVSGKSGISKSGQSLAHNLNPLKVLKI